MSEQVVKGLFQQLICTRFRLLFFKNSILLVSYLAFDCIQIYPLHEIDLDVHRTDLQVVPFFPSIIFAVSIFVHRFAGCFTFPLHCSMN